MHEIILKPDEEMRETTKIINVDGLAVELTRKNVKRMNMRITSPDARVVISAPYLTPEWEVVRFVRTKRAWIDRNITNVITRAAARPAPQSAAEKERLRAALKARIAGRLPAIEQQTGLRCNGWSVRDMHTRWGSCNTKTHHINFSLMLANRSDAELDYVIVHELVHTRVANHGPEFYAYMDRLMPGWKSIRKQLKY